MDLSISTGLLDFCVCDAVGGNAEEDILTNRALVEGWFLGDEGERFSVLGGGEAGDGNGVIGYAARLNVIEAF